MNIEQAYDKAKALYTLFSDLKGVSENPKVMEKMTQAMDAAGEHIDQTLLIHWVSVSNQLVVISSLIEILAGAKDGKDVAAFIDDYITDYWTKQLDELKKIKGELIEKYEDK